MADVVIEWDEAALKRAAGHDEQVRAALEARTSQITQTANSLGAGFRTGRYHRDHQSPAVGGTAPAYEGDVETRKDGNVGIVHPANYAAMADNFKHNTLLKAKG